MNRYAIKQDDYILHLYYPNLEAAKQAYPNAIIEPYEDNSFVNYIKKIMAMAEDTSANWWKIPYGCGYIAYRQFKDEDGWLDGCEYIRYDERRHTVPFMKTLSNPKQFYERFFDEDMFEGEHGFAKFSKRQFNKLKGKAKPVRFCKINSDAWYVDGYGNFYECFSGINSKEQIKQWEKFHGNSKAVQGKIWHGIFNKSDIQWYSNMEEFMADFKAKSEATPCWAGTPRYEVMQIGYKKLHPYDRMNYIRLPYYPINKIPKAERKIPKIINSWGELSRGIDYYKNGFYDGVYFEKVLKKYWEWVDKKENV